MHVIMSIAGLIGLKIGNEILDSWYPFLRVKILRCTCKHYVPTGWVKGQHQSLEKRIVCIGNPGVGKSTLLNGMCGTCLFTSGLAVDGKGVTREHKAAPLPFNTHYHDSGIVLSDTPGLMDAADLQDAANQILSALNQKGQFKVFFVIRFQHQMVSPADLNTIASIVSACRGSSGSLGVAGLSQFGVIVNMVEEDEMAMAKFKSEDELARHVEELVRGLDECRQCAVRAVVNKKDVKLEKKENKVRPLSRNLQDFIDKQVAIPIDGEKVLEQSDIMTKLVTVTAFVERKRRQSPV